MTAYPPPEHHRTRRPVPPPTHRGGEDRRPVAIPPSTPMAVLDRPTAPMPAIRPADDVPHHGQPTPPPTPHERALLATTAEVAAGSGPIPAHARRAVRGVLLVGVALATAAVALALPRALGSGSDGDGTRLEAADGPVASAALLRSDGDLGVTGSLTDSGQLPRTTADGSTSFGLMVPPSDGGPSSSHAATTASGQATTTTAWVEPTLPPESEWVDTGNGVLVPDVLLRIRFCESTNNYTAVNANSSARGAYQFLTKSWEWYGHAERTGAAQAHLATPAQQDEAALRTLQSEGTSPWAESRPCWNDPDIHPDYATAKPTPRTTTPRPSTTATTAPTGSTDTTAPTSSSSTPDGSTTSTTAGSSSTSSTAPTSSTSTTAPTTSSTSEPTSTST